VRIWDRISTMRGVELCCVVLCSAECDTKDKAYNMICTCQIKNSDRMGQGGMG
jgi:hypothetical protein